MVTLTIADGNRKSPISYDFDNAHKVVRALAKVTPPVRLHDLKVHTRGTLPHPDRDAFEFMHHHILVCGPCHRYARYVNTGR
jgi:hypothetical protein